MYEVMHMNSKETVAPSTDVNTYLNFVAIRELNTSKLKSQNLQCYGHQWTCYITLFLTKNVSEIDLDVNLSAILKSEIHFHSSERPVLVRGFSEVVEVGFVLPVFEEG